MSLEIGRFTPSAYYAQPVTPARSVDTAAHAAKHDQRAHDVVVGDIPPAPPKEVRDQVDQAAEIAKKMAESNPPRELHFSMDEKTNRVVIEVRDLDGKVIRTIPPSHALQIMSGQAQI
jgi:flagellar protein FlaG